MKKNATPLLLGALIIAVPLAVLLFINPRKAQAAWYDYSYGHRQALTITNNGTTQTSWPVQINIDTATLVGAGKMQSDCDDARFALADGTELTYFLEAGCNTSNTIFWVEIPSIESGLLSIYFYYSNTAATSASNFIDPAGAVNYGNGADGDITISADTNINTTSSISGRSCADGGDAVNYTVTENRSAGTDQIVLSSTPSTGCLAVGDEILIINLMGTSGANGNVGKWETARITAISTATLTLNHDLINAYDGTTQQIMVQRIPNYNDVTLSNSGTDFTANDFNGTKNGVMMFRANGTVTVAANTTINTNSMGYRGGAAGSGGAVGGTNGESYDGTVGSGGSGSNAGTSGGGDGGGNDTTAPAGVVRGGGGGGGASGGTSSSNNAGAGGGGGYGYGGGGGGAGRDGTGTSGSGGSAASASINAGGGGGGRNTSGNGGNGGNAGSAGTSSTGSGGAVGSGTTSGGGGGGSNNAGGSGGGGGGGGSYGSSTLDRIFFGSGGGGGGDSVVSGTATAGADGGGIVYIGANTVSVSGSVQANGGTADTGSTDRAGTGGSGSGGSVYITGASVTLGTNLVTATGGGVVTGGTSTAGGGAGGDGRIYVTYSTVSGSTNPTATTAALPVAGSISNEENAPTLTGAKLYWKLDTGYGTVANDSSNYGNSGTISNAVWRDESYCKNGKCLYFDGAGDLVSRANDNEVNFAASDDFTIMGWFRHPTIATSADYIVAKHASGTAGGYKIYMDSDGDIAFGIDDDGTWDPEDVIGDDQSRNYDDSRWHHFAAVKDGTTGIYLYIDGELVDSDTALAATGSLSNETAFYVGVDADGSSNGWDGFLDEIKIFDEVRSIGEIRADMQPSAPEEGASASFGSRELASLSDGLVAYWKMDESAWSGVSGEVVDSSGNGNHGTAAGTPPTTGQGRYNQGGVFNGTNDYINCGTNSSITGLTAFTFATWVKTSASSGTPLLSFSSNSTTLQIENPTNRSLLLLGPNNYRYFSNSTVNLGDGEWHHVVFTIPGSSQLDILKSKMYVDGVLQANSTDVSTGEQNSKTSCLISRYATAYFNGTQDEIRLYNRELSKEEVLALYQFAPKPILHYKFDENTGTTTAYDYAGSGNDLTLTNMTANSWQQGKFGSSLLFNRSSAQYATGSDSAATSITEDLTLSAWIKPKTTTLSTEYDIAGKRNADSLSYLLTQYGDELRFYIDSTSNYVETSATNLSTNTWYHVEAVYKAADQSAKIYVNGVQQTTTTTGTIPTSISDNSDAFYVSNYTNGVETVIDRQVSTGTDDAHAGSIENDVGRNVATAGVLATGDAVLAPGSHESNDEYSAGARFTNITIPQGTDIVNAIFTLTVDVAWDASPDTVSYHVSGQDADDAPTFGGVGDSLDTTERPRTTADAGPWDQTTTDNAGDEESLVVTDVVQEIIDRPGWSSGNALVMLIDTTAATTQAQWQEYESYEGSSSLAPKLSITYSTGASNYYDGDIDEVKLYNYARNSSQIIEDMNGGHPVGGSPISSKVIQYNFDEQNGSTANNSNPTQSGITGSISGASWLLSNNCKYNGCLDFDGTDDVVTVTNASPIDFDTGLASAFTISAWINPDTDGEADTGQIFQKGTNTWCRTDNESGGNVDIECSLDLATTDATVNVSAAVPTNTWSHFAIAYTDDTDDEITVYINGVAMGSSTNGVGAPAGSDSNNLLIGGTTANNFDGSIDDFKVYASELTASQILIDKNANAATSIGTGTTKSSLLSGGAGNPPIAWITFDDNTGTSAKDVSGSGNTCTLTSMPTNPWVKGKYGTALDFQKTNDIASCGSAAALDNLSALTVEAWIKPRASSTYEQIVAKAETAAPANGWLFESNMANNNLEFWVDYATDDLVRISANNVLVDDVWQHVAVTWTGSSTATNAKLYVNGKEVSYTTTTNAAGARNDDDAGTLTIGNDVTTTDDFDGAIDEVKVYNYVRTPQQIAFDYSQGKPIGWWKLDECTGGTANDSSGSGNTGTITIGATGSNTATGTCSSGTGTEAWNNGTTGKFNGSLDFDGTNDYVTTTDSRHLSASQGTVSLWFNHDDTGSGLELMFAHRAATESGNNRIYLGVTTSDTLAVGIGDVSTQDTGDAITNGSWHMGTLTWDNGNYYAYLDGNLVHSGTYTNFTGIATCLVIGAYGQNCAGFNSYFDGQIDDVRVYNYALTQSEILTIKNQGAAIRFGQ